MVLRHKTTTKKPSYLEGDKEGAAIALKPGNQNGRSEVDGYCFSPAEVSNHCFGHKEVTKRSLFQSGHKQLRVEKVSTAPF